MSAIFQTITIGWRGQEYVVEPNMRLINAIENHVSLAAIAAGFNSGAPKLSHLATALSVMLQWVGAQDATDEAVYMELLNGNDKQASAMAAAIMHAAFPITAQPKKKAAARKPAAKKASKKKA